MVAEYLDANKNPNALSFALHRLIDPDYIPGPAQWELDHPETAEAINSLTPEQRAEIEEPLRAIAVMDTATAVVGTVVYPFVVAPKVQGEIAEVVRQGAVESQAAVTGAKDAPLTTTEKTAKEWIYGPKNDPKINPDGSTKPNTWTTPNLFRKPETATDKLDPFKPIEGRRQVTIPEGTGVQRGITPGKEGPYNGSGGANETLIPGGLPQGSVGPWRPF